MACRVRLEEAVFKVRYAIKQEVYLLLDKAEACSVKQIRSGDKHTDYDTGDQFCR